MKNLKTIRLVISVSALIFMSSCRGPVVSDPTVFATNVELAQQVGDSMSSVDEASGSVGNFALMKEINAIEKSAEKSIALFENKKTKTPRNFLFSSELNPFIITPANAITCFGNGFSACSSSAITRTFNNCTVGAATFSGSVNMTFSGPTAPTCKLQAAGDTVVRNPAFTISLGSANISVSKTGVNGQTLSWVSGAVANKVFSLANDGIRRTLSIASVLKYDVTTLITSPITVTGSDRTNRIMNGGTLRLQNNLTTEQCDIVPSNVTWVGGTCTCATSGSWSGTCQTRGAFTMTITGCGTANLTIGTETSAVTLNRCSAN